MTCPPGEPCEALTDYVNYKVGDFGPVSGEVAMMSEIYKRGPISCSLDAGPIESYTGGVFYDNSTQCGSIKPNPEPRPRRRTLTVNFDSPRQLRFRTT